MTNPEFIYTTYIKTTPEEVWAAITNPEFSRQYWVDGITSDWTKGSKWQHVSDDGKHTVLVSGEVLESVPPNRLVLTWADPSDTTDDSHVTFEIEAIEDMVRLNVIHSSFKAGSKMAGKVAVGWPRVLSSLKSLLETGKPLDTWAGHTMRCGTPVSKGVAV
jgi:uncharacterized protein YndB with AHSA1/START domain